MARVEITVNGRTYEVACDDGQEEHLTALAREVDQRVRQLAGSVGAVGEARLLVMASLLIADELTEARREGVAQGGHHTAAVGDAGHHAEERAAAALESCAERLEHIAERLEAS